MDYIYLNCIRYDYSIADGPGLRTLIFMQGCDLRCPFCQNEKIWDKNGGYKWSIKILINELKKNSITKKVTITGGEPLFNYLKYGPFILSKRTSTIPFVGSSNQVFEKLR